MGWGSAEEPGQAPRGDRLHTWKAQDIAGQPLLQAGRLERAMSVPEGTAREVGQLACLPLAG